VSKFGSGNRATFVSPYLRRPLRPLKKVMIERQDGAEGGQEQPANDLGPNDLGADAAAAQWSALDKRAVVSD